MVAIDMGGSLFCLHFIEQEQRKSHYVVMVAMGYEYVVDIIGIYAGIRKGECGFIAEVHEVFSVNDKAGSIAVQFIRDTF